jgi:hypothetical protein
MAKFLKVLLVIVAGYVVGVAAGLLLVSLFSGNTHDRGVEQVMTAFFFTGPIGALIGLVWGLFGRTSAAK